MYIWMLFPAPSLKWLSARFLHHWEATRPCCCMPNIYCRSCLGCWRVSLKCWVGRSLNDSTVNFCRFSLCTCLHFRPMISVSLECTGPHKRNSISLVFIRCVVLELQLFFQLLCWPSSWKHGATTFWNALIKSICILRTMQCVQLLVVSEYWSLILCCCAVNTQT